MTKSGFQVELDDDPQLKVFVNGLEATTWRGRFWLLRNGSKILKATRQAPGCVAFYAAHRGFAKTLLVSYWRSETELMNFLRTNCHKAWMKHAYQYPDDFILFNEYYDVTRSGHYLGEKRGLACFYKSTKDRLA